MDGYKATRIIKQIRPELPKQLMRLVGQEAGP